MSLREIFIYIRDVLSLRLKETEWGSLHKCFIELVCTSPYYSCSKDEEFLTYTTTSYVSEACMTVSEVSGS